MNERIKGSIFTIPIISVGGLILYGSLKFRQSLSENQLTILFFTGAIILAIGLSIRDVKSNEQVTKKETDKEDNL